ncbi:Pentatricopeptide repeat-containing protein At2g34400 [Linum grandiflorum]
MKVSGQVPDNFTYPFVFISCANVLALDCGRSAHSMVFKYGLDSDDHVAHSMITMYAKCGQLDCARKVFDEIPQRDLVSWNSMISGYAQMGSARKAMRLFLDMRDLGIDPNEITFVAVLSACVHGGLVDEGRQLFEMMKPSFGVVPTIEHFSCMVDLLARAGLLHEAWEFIEKMPGKPDEIVLGALLAACRKKKNEDVSERVIKLLLEVEPSNSGNYVISSKIYADMRRWEESANVRVLMRERGVTKTPGCSWIELESQVHEFHAGDSLPDQSVHMYQLLNEQMRKEGYVPKPDSSSR